MPLISPLPRRTPEVPGDLLVYGPGDVRGCCQQGETPFSCTSITISPCFLTAAKLRGTVSVKCYLIVLFAATSVGVIVAAASLFTALLSTLGGDRRALNPWFFAGFIAVMAGLATVSMAGGGGAGADGAGANPLLGDFLALGAYPRRAIHGSHNSRSPADRRRSAALAAGARFE